MTFDLLDNVIKVIFEQCTEKIVYLLLSPVKVPSIASVKVKVPSVKVKVKDEKKEKLIYKWKMFKHNLLSINDDSPIQILMPPVKRNLIAQTPTEWVLEYVMKIRATFQYLFPLMLEMAELCLSNSVSSAWLERGASCVKRVKTQVRLRLKNDMLESLIHVLINGPKVKDSTALIDSTLKQWLAKPRRKMCIANKRHASNAEGRAHCDTVNVHDQEMENESSCEQEELEDNAWMDTPSKFSGMSLDNSRNLPVKICRGQV